MAGVAVRVVWRQMADAPTDGTPVRVLLSDGLGVYEYPDPVRWDGRDWVNAASGVRIVPKAVAWGSVT